MTLRNPGRLAIHRRSDEIAFLQKRLCVLSAARTNHVESESQGTFSERTTQDHSISSQNNLVDAGCALQLKVWAREHDLADELLHTRQIEPLGETLQRRLAMAERVCRDLSHRAGDRDTRNDSLAKSGGRHSLSDIYWVPEIERRALAEMLELWLAWLRES